MTHHRSCCCSGYGPCQSFTSLCVKFENCDGAADNTVHTIVGGVYDGENITNISGVDGEYTFLEADQVAACKWRGWISGSSVTLSSSGTAFTNEIGYEINLQSIPGQRDRFTVELFLCGNGGDPLSCDNDFSSAPKIFRAEHVYPDRQASNYNGSRESRAESQMIADALTNLPPRLSGYCTMHDLDSSICSDEPVFPRKIELVVAGNSETALNRTWEAHYVESLTESNASTALYSATDSYAGQSGYFVDVQIDSNGKLPYVRLKRASDNVFMFRNDDIWTPPLEGDTITNDESFGGTAVVNYIT